MFAQGERPALRAKSGQSLSFPSDRPAAFLLPPPEEGPAVPMQLRGVVEDVELVHWTLQADASQLEVHGELEEPADRVELQLAVVSDESSCSTNVTCLCLLPPLTRVSFQQSAVAVGVRPDGGVPVLPLTGHRPAHVVPRPGRPHQAGVDKVTTTL